jgi:CPA1 family monovalent cation:H+ antiporter
MNGFDLAAVFLALVGAVGWLNARYLHMPTAAAMVLAGLASGGLLLAARAMLPSPNAASHLIASIGELDFPQTVLGYMLAFLLFAGASQVSLAELRKRLLAIASLATLGVLASTLIVGFGLWFAASALGLGLTLPWAFVFGALISPTDPIAVLAAVKAGNLSKTLEAVLQGEALFNDGVGIVVFSAALMIASAGAGLNVPEAVLTVGIEALGGLALGGATAWVVTRAMREIDDYGVEVGLTIALAAGAYALANALHLSGAIAVVVAGLIVGDQKGRQTMSAHTERYLRGFWALVDEVLNALLFLLLGLELLVIPFDIRLAGLWAAAILLVLVARFVVVLPAGAWFGLKQKERGATVLLGWGGLHGALSLALALSIPAESSRAVILSVTFAVVIFSVVVQGLTFGPLSARLGVKNPDLDSSEVG